METADRGEKGVVERRAEKQSGKQNEKQSGERETEQETERKTERRAGNRNKTIKSFFSLISFIRNKTK